jgi:hypothetical protein
VVFTVLDDQRDAKNLQYKEHQEIKITAEKKKDITHRRGILIDVEFSMSDVQYRMSNVQYRMCNVGWLKAHTSDIENYKFDIGLFYLITKGNLS